MALPSRCAAHMSPSGPVAISPPIGSSKTAVLDSVNELEEGVVVITPAGVMRPIKLPSLWSSAVNHRLPSGPR